MGKESGKRAESTRMGPETDVGAGPVEERAADGEFLPSGAGEEALGEVEVIAPEPSPSEREAVVADLQNKLLYLHAEFDNFRKRTEKRYREALDFATEPLLLDLLPVLDNLERAVTHGRDSGDAAVEALTQGLENVIQQFVQVLSRHGVEPIPAGGQKFDPAVHEAVVQVPGDADGMVGEVFEKGFKLKGRLLRPAKVAVTKVASPGSDG
jgi:molecular chaperone GrpE